SLIAAFNSGDAGAMEAFNQKFRDPQSLNRGNPQGRADSYKKLFERIRKLTIVEYASDMPGRTFSLLRNAKGQYYQLSLFFFHPYHEKLDGYWLGEAAPRTKSK